MILACFEEQEIAMDICSRFQLASSQVPSFSCPVKIVEASTWEQVDNILIMSAQIINHKATLSQRS